MPSLNFSITFHDIIYTLISSIIIISIGYIYNSVNSVLAINHAINLISPFFGSVWRVLHLPLHLGISLVGLALTDIIKNIYVYRNYPNNTYDETLSPTLPATYYSGLEMFYQSDKYRSQSVEEPQKYRNINLGKAVHSIEEIKALLAVAFLITFISVFFMKFLHRYSMSSIIDNPEDIDDNISEENDIYNEKINKATLSSSLSSIKGKDIIKTNDYTLNEEPSKSQNEEKAEIKNETSSDFNNSNTNNANDLLNMKRSNFYKLDSSLKNSIIDLANNKKKINPKAQDIINRCSNDKIANNIREMNNNAVITTYVNSSLTLLSFFIFLFQVLLILLFLVFSYIKIPISILLILTLIIVEIELITELLLPRLLKITNKRKNIKILPVENINNDGSNSNINNI